jgi:hypothetical protein
MLKPTDHTSIDKRINDFMARKSPWKQFGKSITEQLAPASKLRKESRSDISYEPLEWTHDSVARTPHYRKLAS